MTVHDGIHELLQEHVDYWRIRQHARVRFRTVIEPNRCIANRLLGGSCFAGTPGLDPRLELRVSEARDSKAPKEFRQFSQASESGVLSQTWPVPPIRYRGELLLPPHAMIPLATAH